jgi:hypothetical protein
MPATNYRATARAVSTDPADLSLLLPDWSRHVRAANLSPDTIDSYSRVGRDLLACSSPTARSATTSRRRSTRPARRTGRRRSSPPRATAGCDAPILLPCRRCVC